jgi:hypothetical protein
MRTVTVLGLVVVVVGMASGCKGRSSSSGGAPAASERAFATDTLPVDGIERSGAICERLISAGVAKNCEKAEKPEKPRPSGLRGPVAFVSRFEPVGGFPKDKCTVRVDHSDKEFKEFSESMAIFNVDANDFPRAVVFSTAAAMWRSSVYCDAAFEKSHKWDDCREKKPAAACAKLFPAEYARYRALHDAAVRIVDGRK